MKTSALKARITSFSRKERDARGHRTALLPCLSLSAPYSAIAVCSSPGTEIPGEKTLLFRWKGGGGEKEKERGKQRGRKEHLSAFSAFAIFANVFRYGPSRKKHNVYCTTHCIDVSKICVAFNCVKTNVPILCLSLSLSFEFHCPRC